MLLLRASDVDRGASLKPKSELVRWSTNVRPDPDVADCRALLANSNASTLSSVAPASAPSSCRTGTI